MEMKFSSLKLSHLISRWLLLSRCRACWECSHHSASDPASWAGSSGRRWWRGPGCCCGWWAPWPGGDTGRGGENTGHWGRKSWDLNGKLSLRSVERRQLRIQKPVKRGHTIFHKMTNLTLLSVPYTKYGALPCSFLYFLCWCCSKIRRWFYNKFVAIYRKVKSQVILLVGL